MKCEYCNVINDKDYGLCNYCGAPLPYHYDGDEDDDDYNISITQTNNLYKLNVITLDEWKKVMTTKGLDRMTQGVMAVKNMPDITLDDNINRMASFLKSVSFKSNKRKE